MHCLKHGIEIANVKLDLLYTKPATSMNEKLIAKVNKNIFSVVSLSDFSVCVCENDGRIVYEHNGEDERIRLAAVIITPTDN